MSWLRTLTARIKGIFGQKQLDWELEHEIRAHLEMLEEENRRQGMSAEQAHSEALKNFGGVAQTANAYRQQRGLRFVETLGQDLRYAVRVLARNPGFSLVVIASLALGIGANTAIFSAIDAVMLRLLPVEEPRQLVMLEWHSKDWPEKFLSDLEGSTFDENGGGMRSYSLSYPAYEQFRDHNHVFSTTFAFAANDDRVNVGVDGRAEAATI